MLDRQAVTIPAGHEDRVRSAHRARLDHHVLQNLVERGPHMDVAIRVGRPVVQNPEGSVLTGGAEPAVDVHRLPAREHLGLGLRQVGLHRKGRFR